jgi:hypothetical protein
VIHTKLVSTTIDSDLCISNNNNNSINNDNHNDKLVFIKKKQNNTDGFDLTKNNSFVVEKEKYELYKIANYFRKLKLLKFLESPLVSDEYKLKCAEEVLEEVKGIDADISKKNDFWETFDDMFF